MLTNYSYTSGGSSWQVRTVEITTDKASEVRGSVEVRLIKYCRQEVMNAAINMVGSRARDV